jgi:hypothetical protein
VAFRRRVKEDVRGDFGGKSHKPGSKTKSLSTKVIFDTESEESVVHSMISWQDKFKDNLR